MIAAGPAPLPEPLLAAALAPATTVPSPRHRRAPSDLLRVLTINTHRGQGPDLPYVKRYAPPEERARLRILHDTRAYTYLIADWLRQNADRHDIVGLQEVFHSLLGGVRRLWSRRVPQHECYRTVGGFEQAHVHRIGLPAFRYENVLLSRLPAAPEDACHHPLPGRVYRVARCGFTLAPVAWAGRTIWVGNTHLHAYHPGKRGRQAAAIAAAVARLGDVPVLLLGDLNMVPPGCKDGDFPHGGRERRSYKNDRTFALLAAAGLRMLEHRDEAAFWTTPTWIPNRTLDYVLFSRHWDVESYRVLTDVSLSDHYPVEAALRLKASARS